MSIDIKNGRYRARIMVDGKAMSSSFDTREEAIEWEAKQKRAYKGTAAHPLRIELLDYRTRITPTKKGRRQEHSRINGWLDTSLADMSVWDIKLHHVQAWVDLQENQGAAPTTILNRLSVLSKVFQETARKHQFQGLPNPCIGVRRPANRQPKDVRLGSDHEAILLEVCRSRRNVWLWYMTVLAMLTAMRAGELRAFTWNDIDGRTIHLKDTKNGTSRFVPLSQNAVAVLDAWRALVQPKDMGLPVFPVTEYALCNAFRAAVKYANKHHGLPHMTFHDLRHVATTRMSKRLSNILELSAVTGHKSVHMLKRYYHPDPNDIAAKLD